MIVDDLSAIWNNIYVKFIIFVSFKTDLMP